MRALVAQVEQETSPGVPVVITPELRAAARATLFMVPGGVLRRGPGKRAGVTARAGEVVLVLALPVVVSGPQATFQLLGRRRKWL